ncbi:MAG: C40 family peptidase [Lachnospiraceae bacterium]|nr:C40 family peptidase [Lachnospiraceae bacterium]
MRLRWIQYVIFGALAAVIAAGGALPVSVKAAETETVAEAGEEPKAEAEAEDLAPGWNLREDGWYFCKDDLSFYTGWLLRGSEWYYLDSQGRMCTGWQKIDDHWYWLDSDGVMQTGWLCLDGVWYYLKENGRMLTGWQEIDGDWYLLGSNGAMCTGWAEKNSRRYYLKESGRMQTGWGLIDGSWYYFAESGRMQTGWKLIGGRWFYLWSDGRMLTGWLNYKNEWYYLGTNGAMCTGWISHWDQWFLLDDSGRMIRDGWLVRNGHTYHFTANGVMDVDETEPQRLVDMPGYYISPMKAGNLNTTEERIEAMIDRAYDYLKAGTIYKICTSQAPGMYADCSGLVMQCLYAAGFDPAPATPEHHARPENEYDSRTLYYQVPMKHVKESELKRGDLIFYKSKRANVIVHVAIYLGDGKVIESWPPMVTDRYGYKADKHPIIFGITRPFE